jgi:NAD(P)-dependent dehydrogenase (short-subunit alcohol dehydrogenase family)
MSNLESKNVVIVGGSSGIGAANAAAFAEQGAKVTIASRNQAKLDTVAAGISGHVRTAVLDTTDEAAVEVFFATTGQFDHVVISTAQTPGGPVRQLKLSDAYAAMNSTFWGAYRVSRAVQIAQGGSLTQVSGVLSVRPSESAVLQGAINAALEALARGLALEL